MKTPLLDLGIYRVVRCGHNTYRTEFVSNGKIITPAAYCGGDAEAAAIYFTEQFLKQEMEEQIETLLGGPNDTSSLHDVSPLCSGLSIPVPRNGTEEI